METRKWNTTGFDGNPVKIGDTVRIRETGFRGALATVVWMNDNAKCEVTILKADKRTGWNVGNRTRVTVWFLETVSR